jgi:hypothetical protein
MASHSCLDQPVWHTITHLSYIYKLHVTFIGYYYILITNFWIYSLTIARGLFLAMSYAHIDYARKTLRELLQKQ